MMQSKKNLNQLITSDDDEDGSFQLFAHDGVEKEFESIDQYTTSMMMMMMVVSVICL